MKKSVYYLRYFLVDDLDVTLDIGIFVPVVMIPYQTWYYDIDNTDFRDLFNVSVTTYTKLLVRLMISETLDPVEITPSLT